MCTKLWRIEEWAYIVFILLFVSSHPHGMYSSNGMLGLETFFWEVFFGCPLPTFICGLVWEVLFQNLSFHIKRTGGFIFRGVGVLSDFSFGRVIVTDVTSFFVWRLLYLGSIDGFMSSRYSYSEFVGPGRAMIY